MPGRTRHEPYEMSPPTEDRCIGIRDAPCNRPACFGPYCRECYEQMQWLSFRDNPNMRLPDKVRRGVSNEAVMKQYDGELWN